MLGRACSWWAVLLRRRGSSCACVRLKWRSASWGTSSSKLQPIAERPVRLHGRQLLRGHERGAQPAPEGVRARQPAQLAQPGLRQVAARDAQAVAVLPHARTCHPAQHVRLHGVAEHNPIQRLDGLTRRVSTSTQAAVEGRHSSASAQLCNFCKPGTMTAAWAQRAQIGAIAFSPAQETSAPPPTSHWIMVPRSTLLPHTQRICVFRRPAPPSPPAPPGDSGAAGAAAAAGATSAPFASGSGACPAPLRAAS